MTTVGLVLTSLLLLSLQPLTFSSSDSVAPQLAFVRKTQSLHSGKHNTSSTVSTTPHGYNIVDEKVVYSKWRILLQRLIQLPNGKVADFDIVSQKGAGAAIVFVWDSNTKTATLVREYNPGPHEILYGLAAGLIEQDKHNDSDPRVAAEYELNEECHLEGGTWHMLTDRPIAMDKYVDFRVHAYLVIDPTPVEYPRPLDDEEIIEIIRGVTLDEIKRMLRGGEMNMVASWASLLALERLRDLGEIE